MLMCFEGRFFFQSLPFQESLKASGEEEQASDDVRLHDCQLQQLRLRALLERYSERRPKAEELAERYERLGGAPAVGGAEVGDRRPPRGAAAAAGGERPAGAAGAHAQEERAAAAGGTG